MADSNQNIHVLHDVDDLTHTLGSQGSDAIVLGLTGAIGGAGVTSLAVQFAYKLAQQSKVQPKKRSVCVISLDFENCALAYFLDHEPVVGLKEFQNDPETVDPALAKTWMTTLPFGFDALLLPNIPGGNQQAKTETVLAFLDSLCSLYDVIVLDVPRLWTPWTHASLGAADRVGMVTELTVPALHQANAKASGLTEAIDELSRMDFIINKFERRSFRNSLKLSDAEHAFGGEFVHAIAMSVDKVRESINRGEPVGSAHPDSRFAKDANDILAEWITSTIARRERESLAASTFC